ncbi:MAG: 23S rRNA (pseudouridine(1915)-N(3))-methyltransferase RlmH, partial [Hungatella sp.]
PDQASAAVETQIKNREGERILAQIKEGTYVIALAIQGQMLDSVELAKKIHLLGVSGTGQITFVIGGSLGLSEAVLHRADYLLSFSRMTFPHQLMRVILLEQIYRAYRINCGEPYHK